ncbi:MAG TPA: ABC transporter substrate-binding protein [Opitutaceae bacterium]|nr:ABC transporter substrate-binding protein [Opitutaceae bacterium]
MRPFLLSALALTLAASLQAAPNTLRVGYFPNITHAQGLIGAETTREHRGWFEQRLGPGVTVEWYPFNAGPGAMEAIFAGSIDLTYVGPNPALNAYIRSGGDEIRVLAGAAEGGAALVVPADGSISKPADFRGKKVATPQLGNTQDIAARAWLKRQGFRVTLTGGDVLVIPTDNPDQLGLFQRRQIDAVWTVEPWVSRLVSQAGGKVYLEQSDAITTVLVASVKLLRERPELARKFVAAHDELTAWINSHPAEAQDLVRKGLAAATRREMPAALVASSWQRLRFADRVPEKRFAALVADAQAAGLLRRTVPLDRMFSGRP